MLTREQVNDFIERVKDFGYPWPSELVSLGTHDTEQRQTIATLEQQVIDLKAIISECVRLVRCGESGDIERYAND